MLLSNIGKNEQLFDPTLFKAASENPQLSLE